MIEITASDIFWIGAMDRISIGLLLIHLVCFLLLYVSSKISSVGLFLFALFLGLGSFTAWVFTPSSQTLAAMKVLPAIVNNQRIQGVAESALELTERFLKENLKTQTGIEGSNQKSGK